MLWTTPSLTKFPTACLNSYINSLPVLKFDPKDRRIIAYNSQTPDNNRSHPRHIDNIYGYVLKLQGYLL